jgi:hypothetical protein
MRRKKRTVPRPLFLRRSSHPSSLSLPRCQGCDKAGGRIQTSSGFWGSGLGTVREYDPSLLLDSYDSTNPDDYTAGFPMHPHRGIETISCVYRGLMTHRDSPGNEADVCLLNSLYGDRDHYRQRPVGCSPARLYQCYPTSYEILFLQNRCGYGASCLVQWLLFYLCRCHHGNSLESLENEKSQPQHITRLQEKSRSYENFSDFTGITHQ